MPDTTAVLDLVRTLLREAELKAEHARALCSAKPLEVERYRESIIVLSTFLESELKNVYSHVFAGPGGSRSKEFEYRSTGAPPYPSVVDALAHKTASFVVLAPEVRKAVDCESIEIVARVMTLWRTRYGERAQTTEEAILAMRALGLISQQVRVMLRNLGNEG